MASPIENNILLGGKWFDEENDNYLMNSKSILETNIGGSNKDIPGIDINENYLNNGLFFNQFPPLDIVLPTWIALPNILERPPEIWLLEITEGGVGSSQLIARHPLESYTTMIVLDDTPSFQNNYISINSSYSRNHQQKEETIQENSIYSTSEIQAIIALDPKSCSGTSKRHKLEFHLINCSKINNKNNNSNLIETKVNGKILVERGSSIILKAGDRFTLSESTCSYRLVRGQVSDKKVFAAAWDPTVLAATLSQQSIIAKILRDDDEEEENSDYINNSNNKMETKIESATEINVVDETSLNDDKSNEKPSIIINHPDLNKFSQDSRLTNKRESFLKQQKEEVRKKSDENNLHFQQIKERDEAWNRRKKLNQDSSIDKIENRKMDINKGNNSKTFNKKELDLDNDNINDDNKFSTRGRSRDKTSSKSRNKYNDRHSHSRGKSRSLSDDRDRRERRGRSRDKASSSSRDKTSSKRRTRYNVSHSRSSERDRYRKRTDHNKDKRRKSYSRSRSRSYNRYKESSYDGSDRHNNDRRSKSIDRSKKKKY